MYQIKKLRADHVIDFAAEELKKYLRMMMPECGDISISYEPGATEGFRLGLAEDFGLSFADAEDPMLDDVVHIDTDQQGGILAGSNSRSVLFAVYRLLKENGCRWLYPGIDGEHIPIREIAPVQYHHLPSCRFRGQCNEGAESQQCMMETIDFYAKLEMNVYMIEFDIPFFYYNSYYSHKYNTTNRPPEPVTKEQVLQWKRQCEVEIAKRGLQFHDMGHGWTADPFGLTSIDGWNRQETPIPEDILPLLAKVNGKRGLYNNVALCTNICMSNPKARKIMVDSIADYAQNHTNVSYIHVWLADDDKNYCECEECIKLRPADYYLMIMNELDEELTRRNLDTRIVFIAYNDTRFAPLQETIRNTTRFSMLYACGLYYTSSIEPDKIPEPPAYTYNNKRPIRDANEAASLLLEWQKSWHGPCFRYDYHFFINMFRDPGTMYISRRIFEDNVTLQDVNLQGCVEDASQRPFFPNGFAMYVYAQSLLDRNCNYDKLKEEYFSHIYGEDWQQAVSFLQTISDLFDFVYMQGKSPSDPAKGSFYKPEHVQELRQVKEVTAKERAFALEHFSMPTRPQTVSMRLLYRHAEFCERYADLMIQKALGNQEAARQHFETFSDEFGRYEWEMERYYDHFLAMQAIAHYLNK